MPLNNFYQKHISSKIDGQFITSINYWVSQDEQVKLVKCKYSIEYYKSALYTEYNLRVPSSIKKAVNKRQAEFLAGRVVAKVALIEAGFSHPNLPDIGFCQNRCPAWPRRYVGSITHSSTDAICVLSNNKNYLGVDIEDILSRESASQISHLVHNDCELNLLSTGSFSEAEAITIIFSAKESLFKALYPSINVYFNFDSARVVSVDMCNRTLRLQLVDEFVEKHGIKAVYDCRFLTLDKAVITLIS